MFIYFAIYIILYLNFNKKIFYFINAINILILIIYFLFQYIFICYYFFQLYNFSYLIPFISYYFFNNYIIIDLFSIILLILLNILFLFSAYLFFKFNYYYFIIIFNIFVIILIITYNFIIFFIFYELLLLTFYFFIFFNNFSFNKKNLFLFIFWSQISSLFILITFIIYFNIYKITNFFEIKFLNINNYFIVLCLFFGFGIKIPIWPFNFWIIKFYNNLSENILIFINGFLSKLIIFCFYKIIININFFIFKEFFYFFIFLNIFNITFKLWQQIKIKQILILCSIQEINIILFFFFNNLFILNSLIFIISHSLIISIFFFFCFIFKIFYLSDNIFFLKNLFKNNLKLSWYFIITSIFFSGLPGTIKFFGEFIFYLYCLNYSIFIMLFCLLNLSFISLIFFNKIIFNIVFSNSNYKIKLRFVNKKYDVYYIIVKLLFIILTVFNIFIY